jgi:molybdopterin/thiamine biosynthesis adenylyltransferase
VVDAVPRDHVSAFRGLLRSVRRWRARPIRSATVGIELRVPQMLFAEVFSHTRDQSRGEEAGFLICCAANTTAGTILLARAWLPVPEDAVVDRGGDYVLKWSARFNAEAIAMADEINASLVLVHYHGGVHPRLSGDDLRSARQLFPGVSRLLDDRMSGSVVLGESAASGEFWRSGRETAPLSRLRIVGERLEDYYPDPRAIASQPRRLDRQTRAIGASSVALLAESRVAIIGLSGGGSHVFQQLAHQGVGALVVIDPQVVDETNLGRLVGAERSDVDRTYKTDIAVRLARRLDPSVEVTPIRKDFPHPDALNAVQGVDVVVGCVDSWRAREQINEFCRRNHIPYVDIGINIETNDGHLTAAHGQLVVVTPDSPCMRCLPLLSDAVLQREREQRPPGYDLNSDAVGDPQVVSMNGTLASEASNAVLDLITGFSSGARGPGWWLYDGRRGTFERAVPMARRTACPACAQQGHGDPPR